jgi:molybdopterin-binding protein
MSDGRWYQIGQAAELLGVSPDTVRRWAEAGKLEFRRGAAGRREFDGRVLADFATSLQPEAGSGEPIVGRSARNRFAGIITKVIKDKVAAHVEIQAGPHRVVSLMTREAADELGLRPGMMAVATVKATNVVVELPAER